MNWPTSLIFSIICIPRMPYSLNMRNSSGLSPVVMFANEHDCHRNDYIEWGMSEIWAWKRKHTLISRTYLCIWVSSPSTASIPGYPTLHIPTIFKSFATARMTSFFLEDRIWWKVSRARLFNFIVNFLQVPWVSWTSLWSNGDCKVCVLESRNLVQYSWAWLSRCVTGTISHSKYSHRVLQTFFRHYKDRERVKISKRGHAPVELASRYTYHTFEAQKFFLHVRNHWLHWLLSRSCLFFSK